MMGAAAALTSGFVSLLRGMGVTFKTMCRPAITVQYPDEKLEMPERWRGVLNLDFDKCTSCGACERACPAKVLTVESHRGEDKKLVLDAMPWQSEACAFCDLCVQACPTEALVFHIDYEVVSFTREELYADLAKSATCDVPVTSRPGGDISVSEHPAGEDPS